MRARLPSSMVLLCLVWLLSLRPAVAAPPATILLLGDSLSAAHNIELDKSWPVLLGKRLADMDPPLKLVNASISGETTAAGLARLPALLKQNRPQLVMLELGANDGLRGLPLAEIRRNLTTMLKLCHASGAQVLLLGIELPLNYGPQYRAGLRAIYADLAKTPRTQLVPFLLQGVALDPKLMQPDGLHPTAAAQPRILATVWAKLAPMLKERQPGVSASTSAHADARR